MPLDRNRPALARADLGIRPRAWLPGMRKHTLYSQRNPALGVALCLEGRKELAPMALTH